MIMIKSTSVTKMSKPPPPIPPRPSKNIVAEALAKFKHPEPVKNTVPCREAPPPPKKCEKMNIVVKSSTNVDIPLSGSKIERSFSQSDNSRPVIFQSSNLKSKKTESRSTPKIFENAYVNGVSKNRKNIERNDVKKFDSEIILTNENLPLEVCHKNQKNIELKNKSPNIDERNDFMIQNSSEGNWNDTLNGKNHVNTLIDEMFASILESHDDNCDVTEATEAINRNVISEKHALITANSEDVLDLKEDFNKSERLTFENKSNSSSGESAGHISKTTVLIIDGNNTQPDVNRNNKRSDCIETSSCDDNCADSVKTGSTSNSSTSERKVKFSDKMNHEFLISELESMRKEQARILKRQRKPSQELYKERANSESSQEGAKIHHSDWVEVNDGKQVHLSSCQITIEDSDSNCNSSVKSETKIDSDNPVSGDILVDNEVLLSRLKEMSSLHGLPPLPKSLSGFAFLEQKNSSSSSTSLSRPTRGTSPASSGHSVYSTDQYHGLNGTPEGPTSARNKGSNLDTQLAILRREMYSLRQLDLSLLSQLWSLNESIQDFRQILQDDRALSPPSASPTPSSCDEADPEEFFSPAPLRLRPAPPPPPLRTTSNSSSANSSEYGTV